MCSSSMKYYECMVEYANVINLRNSEVQKKTYSSNICRNLIAAIEENKKRNIKKILGCRDFWESCSAWILPRDISYFRFAIYELLSYVCNWIWRIVVLSRANDKQTICCAWPNFCTRAISIDFKVCIYFIKIRFYSEFYKKAFLV